MPATEARALIAQLPELDVAALMADRAEAMAELAAARRTLGLPETPPKAPARQPAPVAATPEFDPAPLREAAQAVLETARHLEVVGASSAPEAADESDPGALAAADQAVADAEAAQDQLAAAWRRTVGALISGTGIAIVIAALGWPAWSYLIPIVLVAIVTADLRVAGSTAHQTSVRARNMLTALGVGGAEGLERVRERTQDQEAVSRRREEARRHHDEARARWSELAPGQDPAQVENLVARRRMTVTAPVAGARPVVEAEPEDDLPATVDDPVRALALRLAREARDTITLVEDQLAVAARLEHARRSLEWHERQAKAAAPAVPDDRRA
jgi:hypothetical protein